MNDVAATYSQESMTRLYNVYIKDGLYTSMHPYKMLDILSNLSQKINNPEKLQKIKAAETAIKEKIKLTTGIRKRVMEMTY